MSECGSSEAGKESLDSGTTRLTELEENAAPWRERSEAHYRDVRWPERQQERPSVRMPGLLDDACARFWRDPSVVETTILSGSAVSSAIAATSDDVEIAVSP